MENKENYLLPIIPFHKPILTKGKGVYVYDTKGNQLLDLNSGQFCTILGHSNEKLVECVTKNVQKLVHTDSSMLSEEVIYCAENINRISGEMNAYSILLSTGAEAVEFCLRYAKHIKKKKGIICFNKGYHGLTLGAQSITYSGIYANPTVEGIYHATIPDTFAQEEEVQKCIEEFENILIKHSEDIAAAVLEPIVSVGGMILPCAYYFQQIKLLCEKYNILLIFDECQTGFGRTGKWFAYQQYNCIPDMAACAKGAGLGYPVSMALFRSEIVPKEGFQMTHYSSHQNDPFAASIINFGIQYIEENNLLLEVEKKGTYFLNCLLQLSKETNKVKNPRGLGLMLGIDLNIEGIENYRPIYQKVFDFAVEEGVILQATNGGRTLRFLPSYVIEKEDIDFCIHVLKKVLERNF